MTIKGVPSTSENSLLDLEIQHGEYVYELRLSFTIFRQVRVILCIKGEQWLIYNWCSGPLNFGHILKLINAMLTAIERDEIQKLPICSWVKPYFNDEAFCGLIEPYNSTYIDSDDTLLNYYIEAQETALKCK